MPRPAFLLALAVLSFACVSWGANADTQPSHNVVSYLVSTGSEPDQWASLGMGPFSPTPAHPWQWRIFDPVSKRDSLFMDLPSYPMRVRWDSSFTSVEFIAGGRIVRAPWRWGAQMRGMADLPADSLLCDFWFDTEGRVHVLTQQESEESSPEGYQYTIGIATRWDRGNGGKWSAAVVDTGGDQYGSCFTSPRLESGASRPLTVSVTALLDSMRIGNYRDSTLQAEGGDRDWSLVWIGSTVDPSIGLEMKAGFGDSYHAKEPIVWVNRAQNRRETVYPEGQSQNETSGQLAFGERDGFLLVVAEFSGGYPAVVDMRTGEVLFKSDRQSAQAVWVPAPR